MGAQAQQEALLSAPLCLQSPVPCFRRHVQLEDKGAALKPSPCLVVREMVQLEAVLLHCGYPMLAVVIVSLYTPSCIAIAL